MFHVLSRIDMNNEWALNLKETIDTYNKIYEESVSMFQFQSKNVNKLVD